MNTTLEDHRDTIIATSATVKTISIIMNCIVTAGPTFEPLDAVRRLTNLSTGRLGSELAAHLVERGHSVVLLKGSSSAYAHAPVLQAVPFTTTADLGQRLESLSNGRVDAVFHAAAVSDFCFGKIWLRTDSGELQPVESRKISTRDGRLLAELVATPKLISRMRNWFPRAWLVGWKYEVDGGPAYLIARAQQQLAENRTNACVMNGPAYGNGFGLLLDTGECSHLTDNNALIQKLAVLLEQSARVNHSAS